MKNPSEPEIPWLPFESPEIAELKARLHEAETDRQRLFEQMLGLERAAHAGLMTGGMAHDLLNQLTAVLGSAELALMSGQAESLRAGLRDVLEHAGRMHDSVDAYLAFVRLREHRIRTVRVADVVRAAQRIVQTVARGESVVLLSTVATEASVRADPQLLEQAIVNLAMNAVGAAAHGGGRVAITAADAPPASVRITVRDTGPGIRDDVRSRLFEPFVTSRPESGGHGLGLWVVRQIAERYGGSVVVDSSDAGTRIDIEFPSAPAAEESPQAPEAFAVRAI